jgi:hypothetical protein
MGALRDAAYTYLASGQTQKAAERIASARALLPGDCELRMLDHSVRLILVVGRLTHGLRRLDPRALFRRRSAQP